MNTHDRIILSPDVSDFTLSILHKFNTDENGCSTDLDICKTLEDDDYGALLWTSAAEAPGIFFTIFLMVMPCLGRKIVMASEMALLTIFTGLLLICADKFVDCVSVVQSEDPPFVTPFY